ncbi:hypothetical protein ACGF5C_17660 [Micromonospora sp. NPDC047620]|uniref:hypothetical protein n=1 Tax=Micromonospora sp. NPDC047620 TaxID=3364251 RepID=UPI00371E557F
MYAAEEVGDHLPHDTDPAGLPPAYARLLANFPPAERAAGPRLTAAAVRRFAPRRRTVTGGIWSSRTRF